MPFFRRLTPALAVRCELGTGQYLSDIVVLDAEMDAIHIKRAEFHCEGSYTVSPSDKPKITC